MKEHRTLRPEETPPLEGPNPHEQGPLLEPPTGLQLGRIREEARRLARRNRSDFHEELKRLVFDLLRQTLPS